jgi:predicted Zn-dependent peptidase
VNDSTELIGQEALTNNLNYINQYIQIVRSLTPKDIMTVAQKYLDPNRYVLVYALPGKERTYSKTQIYSRGGV